MNDIRRWVRGVLIFVFACFRKPSYGEKVFCVGYRKTGTTSTGAAFRLLGLRHSSYNHFIWKVGQGRIGGAVLFWYTSKFDSFDDLPWLTAAAIPVMDKRFPASKFVFTVREEGEWLRSFMNWHKAYIGGPIDAEAELIKYRQHSEFVESYFKGADESKLFKVVVSQPGAMRDLAKFLGRESVGDDFPHLNKGPADLDV
ncbi:MAG: sulfotransferase [Pseudomonadales bacterium]